MYIYIYICLSTYLYLLFARSLSHLQEQHSGTPALPRAALFCLIMPTPLCHSSLNSFYTRSQACLECCWHFSSLFQIPVFPYAYPLTSLSPVVEESFPCFLQELYFILRISIHQLVPLLCLIFSSFCLLFPIKKKMKTSLDLTNHSIEQTLFNVKLPNRPVPTPSVYNLFRSVMLLKSLILPYQGSHSVHQIKQSRCLWT